MFLTVIPEVTNKPQLPVLQLFGIREGGFAGPGRGDGGLKNACRPFLSSAQLFTSFLFFRLFTFVDLGRP